MKEKLLLRLTILLGASLFFTVFFTNSVFSQKYVPFPIENAGWNVMLSHTPEYFQQTRDILHYTLRGDTTINDKLYKKVCIVKGTTENPAYIGGLRESNKQIFYAGTGFGYISDANRANQQRIKHIKNCSPSLLTENGNEVLLYDFNAKVGETVQWGHDYVVISKIDSVLVGNSYRKRYRLNDNDILIEGIGSVVKGLFGSISDIPACGGSWYWEQICFSENGETVYLNPSYVDCNSIQKWSDRDYLKTGTQWYYGETINNLKKDLSSGYDITYDYNSLKSTGDTIINGIKCNIISHLRNISICFGYQQNVYMYQSNDTVYFYNTSSKKFSTLYVYAAKKDDSWTVEYPNGNVQVLVDSVSSIQALGGILKVQHVTYQTDFVTNGESTYTFENKSKIIENIGDVKYLFMSNIFDLPHCDEFVDYTGLRCYVHPDYGTYNAGTIMCDYVTEVDDQSSTKLKVILKASGNITIEGELNAEPCTLELVDIGGRLILQTEVTINHNSISVENISKGLYIYRLMKNGIMLQAGKLVKN